MAILVKCQCGQEFQTRDENPGGRETCPHCGQEMVVHPPEPVGADEVIAPVSPEAAKTSGKAIASLLLGLCFFCLEFTGLPAILLGSLAHLDIKRSHGRLKGRRLAVAGIVLGVIGLLTLAVLFPATRAAREAARRSQCVCNLKQISLGMHNYHAAFNCFPPAAITDKHGRPLLSWRVAILPWIEQTTLYNRFHLDEPWDSPHNTALLKERPNSYACPSDVKLAIGRTNYQVIVDPKSIFTPDFKPVTIAEITDGTVYTLLVGESRNAVPWTAPQDLSLDMSLPQAGLDSFHSYHTGGFNAAFADGAVKFLKPSIGPKVFEALITRNAGEVVPAGSY